MKNALGGSLFHIATAAMEMTILIKRTRNVPTRAFRACPKRVDIAKERDIAVLVQTKRTMIMGPGLMDTISRRKAAATRRKIAIDAVADRKKST